MIRERTIPLADLLNGVAIACPDDLFLPGPDGIVYRLTGAVGYIKALKPSDKFAAELGPPPDAADALLPWGERDEARPVANRVEHTDEMHHYWHSFPGFSCVGPPKCPLRHEGSAEIGTVKVPDIPWWQLLIAPAPVVALCLVVWWLT